MTVTPPRVWKLAHQLQQLHTKNTWHVVLATKLLAVFYRILANLSYTVREKMQPRNLSASCSVKQKNCVPTILNHHRKWSLLKTTNSISNVHKCVTSVNAHLLTIVFATIVTSPGSYRGAAHSICNLQYRLKPKSWKLPVVIHNLKGYDGHLIVQSLKSEFGKVRVIPQNMERYLSLSMGRLQFLDSFQSTPWWRHLEMTSNITCQNAVLETIFSLCV